MKAQFKVIWQGTAPLIPPFEEDENADLVNGKNIHLHFKDGGNIKGGYSVIGDLTEQRKKGPIAIIEIETSKDVTDDLKAEVGQVNVGGKLYRRFEHVTL